MTASVSPEVIEKWRSEFEACRKTRHPQPCLDRDAQGFYIAMHTWVAWEYWVESRQSAVIELNLRQYFVDGLPHKTVVLKELIAAIESQGYQVNFNQPTQGQGEL